MNSEELAAVHEALMESSRLIDNVLPKAPWARDKLLGIQKQVQGAVLLVDREMSQTTQQLA